MSRYKNNYEFAKDILLLTEKIRAEAESRLDEKPTDRDLLHVAAAAVIADELNSICSVLGTMCNLYEEFH